MERKKQTQARTDEEIKSLFYAYIKENPHATRNSTRLALNTTVERLEKLGLPLPHKIPPSAAARMAKISGGWGKDFRLRGSPKK